LAQWEEFDKQDINDFWEDMPFNLELEEYEGNCSTCWKKSNRKLFRLINDRPQDFDFFRRMEAKHKRTGATFKRLLVTLGLKYVIPRVFFRKHTDTNTLFKMKEEFYNPNPNMPLFNELDENSGCSESCEPF
jgi:hypothetical protein